MTRNELATTFLNCPEFRNRQRTAQNVRVELDDFVMYVDSTDADIGQVIIREKDYEPHVTTTLCRQFKAEHTFLDIGANMGWFTLLAATRLTRGKVIAVEPNYRNLQLLYQSALVNGLSNITFLPYAASDGFRILQLISGVSNGRVMTIENVHEVCEYVPAVPLGVLLRDEPRLDIVKIDIEGYEGIALMGMCDLIAKHRPIIVSEFHPQMMRLSNLDPETYLRQLVAWGYHLAVIESDGTELPASDPKEILKYWEDMNRRFNLTGEGHLDILARPI